MIKHVLTIFLLFLLTSCAGYMNSVYSQLDKEEAQKRKGMPTTSDKFAFYRQKGRGNSSVNPKSNAQVSTSERRMVDPAVKRQYVPSAEIKKRFKAEDLQDNSDPGSLWAGEGKDNSLFAAKHEKQNGDILVINVMANLKNDITAELKRAIPNETTAAAPTAAKPATPAPPGEKPTAPAEKAPAAAEAEATDQSKIYDKISSIIIEEINREHILVRGRKNLLYNSRKVMVEVQALIPRKNIAEDDSIDSNSILESNVRVIR